VSISGMPNGMVMRPQMQQVNRGNIMFSPIIPIPTYYSEFFY
jgi:hypothetical protein